MGARMPRSRALGVVKFHEDPWILSRVPSGHRVRQRPGLVARGQAVLGLDPIALPPRHCARISAHRRFASSVALADAPMAGVPASLLERRRWRRYSLEV